MDDLVLIGVVVVVVVLLIVMFVCPNTSLPLTKVFPGVIKVDLVVVVVVVIVCTLTCSAPPSTSTN